MLERLFGSQARVKILRLFLLHPEETYYIREVARNLGLQVNSVRRELTNMEEFGLLCSRTSKEKGGKGKETEPEEKENSKTQEKKYYYVNNNFVLFEEIRALLVKSQMLYREDFIEELKQVGNTQLIILTGVFVNNPEAIIDLFIVGNANKVKLKKIIGKMEADLGKEINYTLMDYQEFKYRNDITDVFLYNILEQKKMVVVDKVGIS
jgi:predicted transcriptional regulator